MLRTDARLPGDELLPVSTPASAVGIMVVRMLARRAPVRALGVYTGVSGKPLTENDVAWLQAIADRTGMAADNAQLYADSVRRLERLTALRNIGLVIAGSPDLRLILQVILDQVIPA
jgi:GAF domain-containing protein